MKYFTFPANMSGAVGLKGHLLSEGERLAARIAQSGGQDLELRSEYKENGQAIDVLSDLMFTDGVCAEWRYCFLSRERRPVISESFIAGDPPAATVYRKVPMGEVLIRRCSLCGQERPVIVEVYRGTLIVPHYWIFCLDGLTHIHLGCEGKLM